MDTPNPTPENAHGIRFTAEFLWLLLAVMGGISRYLDAYLRTGFIPKVGHIIAHAVVSGFSGFLVAEIIMRISPDWAQVAAGIGGYLGTQGIDWAADVLRSRFGVRGAADPAFDSDQKDYCDLNRKNPCDLERKNQPKEEDGGY